MGELLMAALLFFALVPVFAVVRAAAIQLGWKWFLVPVFPHLQHSLSFAAALGLSLVAGLLFTTFYGADADNAANKGKSIGTQVAQVAVRGIFSYGFYFLFALIVHALQ